MKTKNVFTKKKINPADFTNINSGESLASECANITSVNVINNDLQIITTAEYIMVDSKALRYIQTIFSKPDLEKIFRMANMVRGQYNLLHDLNRNVHTTQTLRTSLNYDESEFCRFMKRLLKKSIIYYLEGYKDNRKYRWIMLNPNLARKSKMFHKDCLNVFENLSK